MKSRVGLVVAAVCLGVASSCSGDRTGPLEPAARPEMKAAQVATTPVVSIALMRGASFKSEVWGWAYIDPQRGGVLQLASAGLTLRVPPGAVSKPTAIWGKALAGNMVAYEFGPHGTTFARPVVVEQDLKRTGWGKVGESANVEAGYFKDVAQLDLRNGTAVVDEVLPVTAATRTGRAAFQITHFSGYLLSTGRGPNGRPDNSGKPTRP